MGKTTVTLQDGDIAARWADALRARYPGLGAAKLVARAFDVSHRTAEAWLGGRTAPFAKYLWRAWVLHGLPIIAEVLSPDSALGSTLAQPVDARLAEVAQQLQALSGELQKLQGPKL
jgi:hypothetical protein